MEQVIATILTSFGFLFVFMSYCTLKYVNPISNTFKNVSIIYMIAGIIMMIGGFIIFAYN